LGNTAFNLWQDLCFINLSLNKIYKHMKHLSKFSSIAAIALMLSVGCATNKNVVSSSSSSSASTSSSVSRGKFVGTWKVSNVTNEGLLSNSTVKRVFDQAPPDAFVGSTWQLTNSGNGLYTLSDGTSQSIYWSFYNPGNGAEPMFQFKKVYAGDKAKNVADGYKLVIGNADGSTMTLKTPVDLGNGSSGYVVYSFTKIK
jgi:hypothetical protein